MALATLQTICQDAFPAYEQTHPLPTHVPFGGRLFISHCIARHSDEEQLSRPPSVYRARALGQNAAAVAALPW